MPSCLKIYRRSRILFVIMLRWAELLGLCALAFSGVEAKSNAYMDGAPVKLYANTVRGCFQSVSGGSECLFHRSTTSIVSLGWMYRRTIAVPCWAPPVFLKQSD